MLNTQALPTLATGVIAIPDYARTGPIGVVHLGLGAFHRAHQALVFDTLLQQGDARWGVLGVAMRSTALANDLAAQHCLYAVQIANGVGMNWRVSGAIWQTCVAAREPLQVVQALAAPSTRWVTLTVTEKGYGEALSSLLVQGLAARQAAGLGGLTIASCDNLTHNGLRLQSLCVEAACEKNPALARWISTECAFPNSMVDRIVPAATPACFTAAAQALGVTDRAALRTEAFWEWVIERRFVNATDGDVLSAVGVKVVDDVGPFEDAKLRLLNGSHTAMACIGAIAGLPTIGECIALPAIHQFIHDLMTKELGPQLSRPDWASYRDALLTRFSNPALLHGVHQIATDSSQKIPQRWVPSIIGALRADLPIDRLAFTAAAWMRYLRGCDERGQLYIINDPMAEHLHAQALAYADNAQATVRALGTLNSVWGTILPQETRWLTRVAHWLHQITQIGVLASLEQLTAGSHALNPHTIA